MWGVYLSKRKYSRPRSLEISPKGREVRKLQGLLWIVGWHEEFLLLFFVLFFFFPPSEFWAIFVAVKKTNTIMIDHITTLQCRSPADLCSNVSLLGFLLWQNSEFFSFSLLLELSRGCSCWEARGRQWKRSRWQSRRRRGGVWAPCSRSSTSSIAYSRSMSGQTCWLDTTRHPTSQPSSCITWVSSQPCWESREITDWGEFIIVFADWV